MLSFDGIGWHDWLRGIPGAEDKTLETIALLRKNDFRVGVETVVHANNIQTLYPTMELLAGEGVGFMKTSPASESGNWRREGGAYSVAVDELYEAYLAFIPRYLKAGSPLTIQLGNFFACKKGERGYSLPLRRFNGTDTARDEPVCGSARHSVQISADGRLLSCMPMAEFPEQGGATDLFTVPLSEALRDSPYFRRIDTRLGTLLKKNPVCGVCGFRLVCGGGCRANAVTGTGDYLGTDADACRFFKGGYEDRIKAAARV
jgi:radical SAM protein with 4Fe4S-binding SPASM domain